MKAAAGSKHHEDGSEILRNAVARRQPHRDRVLRWFEQEIILAAPVSLQMAVDLHYTWIHDRAMDRLLGIDHDVAGLGDFQREGDRRLHDRLRQRIAHDPAVLNGALSSRSLNHVCPAESAGAEATPASGRRGR